ncbi:MAG: ribonuclease [Oscillospiraceae bacterium]|nr:ribonuclease [Oscillospiraceae bacterium]
MKRYSKSLAALVLSVAVLLSVFTGCTKNVPSDSAQGQNSDVKYDVEYDEAQAPEEDEVIYYGESYSDKYSVSAYLYEWQELPPNFITKSEAKKLGWDSAKGNLWDVAEGKSIGGDKFGNREGLLPEGEEYRECDINYLGGYRGGERLVYSTDDYDIYYTSDHYESFEQLYDSQLGYVWTE